MRTFNDLGEPCTLKITAATASFSANATGRLHIPRDKALACTENADLSMLLPDWVGKKVFGFVVADVEDDAPDKQRQDRVLLKLVTHDRGV
jgi:hypothetical protein